MIKEFFSSILFRFVRILFFFYYFMIKFLEFKYEEIYMI